MPSETVGREVVRGTICRDRYVAEIQLAGSDRIPAGLPAPLLVDVRWRERRGDELVPGVPEDQQPIVLSFGKRTETASGDIRFDAVDGPTQRGFAGDTRQLLTMVGATPTVGEADDVTLQVRIEGEERGSLPMSVGPPRVALEIHAADGGPAPAALVAGQPVRLRAAPLPAAAGSFRWLSVPAGALELSNAAADGTVEVVARGELAQTVTLCAVYKAEQSGAVAVATLVLGAGGGLVVHAERDGASTRLADAWVYRREAGAVTVLHTDATGRLLSGAPGSTKPSEYATQYVAPAGTPLELAFSRGAVPLPPALVAAQARAFVIRPAPTPPAPPVVALPDVALSITRPGDLGLWPVSFPPHPDAYATSGLAQGAALFTAAGNLTVAEHAPAPAVAAADRPRERPLLVAGEVEATATAVRVRLVDAAGAAIGLRPGADPAAAPADDLPATLAPAAGTTREFSLSLLPADPAAAMGSLRVVAIADGPRPAFAAHGVLLCGVQAALVADTAAGARGPVPGEADEVVEVDFQISPQTTVALLTAQARARRMVRYAIATRRRPLDPAATAPPGNQDVIKPEMPLWMAELQLVGVTPERLADLMARRFFRDRGTSGLPVSLRIVVGWRLTLSWDGPDAATGPGRRHSYNQAFEARQAFESLHGPAGQFVDASGADRQPDAAGALPDALTPAPAPVPFPVAGRRAAAAIVSGQQRAWGRQAGAAARPATVVEWQPRIVDAADAEIMRGGDGVLEVAELELDSRRLDGEPAISSPPAGPALRPPAFRVRGINPTPGADVNALVVALVGEYHAAHAAEPRIALLTLRCWERTVQAIFNAESAVRVPPVPEQFDSRGAARRSFSGRVYGCEDTLPLFGPPHGYGVGQLDLIFGRGPNEDEVWSFLENIRSAVRLVMEEKATAAYTLVSPHLPTPVDRRSRAVYQREIVRRYNGGHEFRWDGGWVIDPGATFMWEDAADHAKGPKRALQYPNRVLGTGVVYFRSAAGVANQADGAATVFAWPIAFATADFGPET